MSDALVAKRERLTHHIQTQIPGFEILSKKDSLLIKIVSKLFFFNKNFLTNYVTTLYPKVYVPSLPWREKDPVSAMATLAHEYVHLKDRKDMGLLFNFLYLFPQNLAAFALFGFTNPWWYLCLLFLLPIPSPTRAWLEVRGYRMTIAVWAHFHKDSLNVPDLITSIVERNFASPAYYWMFPFKKYLIKVFRKNYANQENIPEIKEVLGVIENS